MVNLQLLKFNTSLTKREVLVSILGSVNRMQCRQWLNRVVGSNTRYTLRSNTTRTITIDLTNIWSLAQTIRIL